MTELSKDEQIKHLTEFAASLKRDVFNAESRVEIAADEIDEQKKEIARLNAIVDMKELQRKAWADMCIKKQQEIDRLEI